MAASVLPSLSTFLCRFRPYPFPRNFTNTTTVHPSLPLTVTTRNLSTPMSLPNSHLLAVKIETPTAGNNEDVLVQYVVLRRDLIDTWPLGSVVTQGCHASVSAIWSHKDDPHTLQYCNPQNIDSMHKVTLEVKGQTQILNLAEKLLTGGIDHKLWIEQPENIPTCLATKPYPKSMIVVLSTYTPCTGWNFFYSVLKQLELLAQILSDYLIPSPQPPKFAPEPPPTPSVSFVQGHRSVTPSTKMDH